MVRSLALLRDPCGAGIVVDSRPSSNSLWMDLGPARRAETEKPSMPKSAGGSQKSLGNSTCSLAVFYVEQVALNRHVSPQQAAHPLMTGTNPVVKANLRQPQQVHGQVLASGGNGRRSLAHLLAVFNLYSS